MEMFRPGCTRIVDSFKAVVLVLMLPVLLAACGGGAEAETQANAIPASTTSPDTTPPAITITGPSNASSYSTSSATVVLSGTASDSVGVTQVTWSNSRGGSGSASGTVSWNSGSITLQGGSNTLTVTARDAAGNISTDTLVVTYSTSTPGDTTAPGISISSPTSSASYTTSSGSLSLGGTASDNVGVTQVSWSNSRGGSGSASGTTSWSVAGITLQDGSNTLTVTARDAAGNQNTDTLTVTYNAPVISNSAILTWDAVAATNLSGYRVYYGTSPGSYQQAPGQGLSVGNITAYTLTGLSNATRYYFSVTAFDTAGNESGYSNEVFKDIP